MNDIPAGRITVLLGDASVNKGPSGCHLHLRINCAEVLTWMFVLEYLQNAPNLSLVWYTEILLVILLILVFTICRGSGLFLWAQDPEDEAQGICLRSTRQEEQPETEAERRGERNSLMGEMSLGHHRQTETEWLSSWLERQRAQAWLLCIPLCLMSWSFLSRVSSVRGVHFHSLIRMQESVYQGDSSLSQAPLCPQNWEEQKLGLL